MKSYFGKSFPLLIENNPLSLSGLFNPRRHEGTLDREKLRNKQPKPKVSAYLTEAHAARAMRRAVRWVKANPSSLSDEMPDHIFEKSILMESVL